MFSVWLGILTPASEGDKGRKERAGASGGRADRASPWVIPPHGFSLHNKRLVGKPLPGLQRAGELEVGVY